MVLSWEDCMRRRERRRRCDDMVGSRDPDLPQSLGCMALRRFSRHPDKNAREHMTVAVYESDTRWYGTDIAMSSFPTGVDPKGGWGWLPAATSARQRIAQARILSSCTLADPRPISSKLELHPVCLSSGIHDQQDLPLCA